MAPQSPDSESTEPPSFPDVEAAMSAARDETVRRPGDLGAWIRRAEVALLLERNEEARRSARTACQLDPQSVEAQLLWARMQAMMGEPHEALQAARRALEAAPDSDDAQATFLGLVERGPLAASEGLAAMGRFLLLIGILTGVGAAVQGQPLGLLCPASALVLLFGSGSLVRLAARLSLEEEHPGTWALYTELRERRRARLSWWRRSLGVLLP